MAWNLVGGVWAGIVVVLATPWFVSRLGVEGYGIVGLWLVMQVMMGVLDLGMGATVVREFADSRATVDSLANKRDLLRTLEAVYWGIAFVVTIAVALGAPAIGGRWLRIESLARHEVSIALGLMALALGLQFPQGLYSSGLSGLQAHGRMNALQMMGNGMRYIGGSAVLLWRPDLVTFFAAQAVVAAAQAVVTRRALWEQLGRESRRASFRLALLRRVWRFSAGMAATSACAVFLANVDRLVLSRMASTAELGRYAIAFTGSGILQLGIQPFYRAFFPRYAELVAAGDAVRLSQAYFRSCRLMAAVIVPLGVVGWAFTPQFLCAWLGRSDDTIGAVLRWLLVGITCSGLTWLPAAFQQAHGWTRLHAAMIMGALVVGTPLLVWAIGAHGTAGATAVWVLHGISDLTLGLWLMHRRLLIGQLGCWYRTVLLPPLGASLPTAWLSWWLMPSGLGRWGGLMWAAGTAVVVLGLALTFELAVSRRSRSVVHACDALASGE